MFNQDELVRERPVVLGEFDRNEANPFFHLTRGADTILWSPGFYTRKTAIGRRDVITSATQEKMNTIKNRFYIPNNSALILAGDITPARGFQPPRVFANGAWVRPFATPAPNPDYHTSTAVIARKPVTEQRFTSHGRGRRYADTAATYAAMAQHVRRIPAANFRRGL